MQYLITFLEGVLSFVSPCVLPLLPLYISYFAGGGEKRVVARAGAFVFGFSVVFCLLGVFAASLGALLLQWQRATEIVCGVIVMALGLVYLDLLPLPFFRGPKKGREIGGIFSAFIFGTVYAVSLSPCVGAFLGAALMMASVSADAVHGFLLLLVYALGMGVPFILTAVFISALTGAFQWIKNHYALIRAVSACLLLAVGLLMITGKITALLTTFN